jgi:hypothetical protein
MRARKSVSSVIVCACCVLAFGLVVVGPASAALTHQFVSSFGGFSGVQGVGIDRSSGDVYVYDAPVGQLLKFDAWGNPVNFSFTGTNVIEGLAGAEEGEGEIAVDNSGGVAKGDIYVANGSSVRVFASTGEGLGELTAGSGTPWGRPCGVSVDASGDVYVGLNPQHVNKYAPVANPVVSSDYVSSLWGLNGVCDVAVDSAGSLYADSFPEGPVFKYEALQFSAIETAASGTEVPGSGRAVSVDPATDDLYVARNSEIAQFDPAEELLGTFNGAPENQIGNTHGIAVKGTSGDVYVSDNNQGRLDVFGPGIVMADVSTGEPTGLSKTGATLTGTVDPGGVEVTSCQFEYGISGSYGQSAPCSPSPGSGSSPVAVQVSIAGLSPNTIYYYRLTATNANGTVHSAEAQFTTLSPPIVEEFASDVNRSTAKIDASIDPLGAETTYRFEYGPDSSYGTTFPVPDGDIGSGSEGVLVGEMLTGLQPGATYHFRVVATNASGTTEGEDRTFNTVPAPAPSPADRCPNAAYRVGLGTGLPDCRAYEMASPVEKYGADVSGETVGQTIASEEGDRVEFMSKTGFGETHGSGNAGYTQYIAERGPHGWHSKGITPTPAANSGGQIFGYKTEVMEFSSDLSVAGLLGYSLPEGPSTARPNSENLYLENTLTSKLFAAVTDATHESEQLPFPPFLLQILGVPQLGGASSSLDVVTFMSRLNLVTQAHGANYKAYVYEHGTVKLLGVLPDGTIPPQGSKLVFDNEDPRARDAPAIAEKDTVSRDGSRILFEANELPGQLFLRKNGETSILVNESETSQPVTAEKVVLEAATPDLKHIVFRTSTRLLDSAPEGGGLYMYTDSPNPQTENNLKYVGENEFPNSERNVLAISDDATRIYYKLSRSLWLWESGQARQIAPEPGVTPFLPTEGGEGRAASDGGKVAFVSDTNLTVDARGFGAEFANGNRSEMYVYREDTNTLKCVSCSSTGTISMAGVETGVNATNGGVHLGEPSEQRFISRDGHYVFFSSSEALVAQDTNGVTDAYEYDTVTGVLSLLSSGTGDDPAWFVDASADGRNVFIVTRQKLTGWDPDKLDDVYDVRVEGGLPEPPAPGVGCPGDACQGTPSAAPGFNTASRFTGLGNPVFTAPAKVKAKTKPNSRLRHALAVCHKKRKGKRARCERLARKRYKAGRSSAHTRAGR